MELEKFRQFRQQHLNNLEQKALERVLFSCKKEGGGPWETGM